MATTRHRRRSRVLTLALALAVAACGDDGRGLDLARSVIADDDRFGSPGEAGESFARAAELLLEDGRACDQGCAGLLEAAAWVQVVAVDVLDCRRPGVHDARVAVLDHLDAVRRAIDEHTPAPTVPALPC